MYYLYFNKELYQTILLAKIHKPFYSEKDKNAYSNGYKWIFRIITFTKNWRIKTIDEAYYTDKETIDFCIGTELYWDTYPEIHNPLFD